METLIALLIGVFLLICVYRNLFVSKRKDGSPPKK